MRTYPGEFAVLHPSNVLWGTIGFSHTVGSAWKASLRDAAGIRIGSIRTAGSVVGRQHDFRFRNGSGAEFARVVELSANHHTLERAPHLPPPLAARASGGGLFIGAVTGLGHRTARRPGGARPGF